MRDIFRVLTDERILLLITGIAILWRAVVSLDKIETLWESVSSGISLFILGWSLFGYLHSMSLKPTQWPTSNKIYHGISLGLLVLNTYVIIYYAMQWYGLLHVEAHLPLDFIIGNIRYVLFIIFYCTLLWSTKFLKNMHGGYRLLLSRSGMHKRGIRALVFKVVTDERTLLVMVGIAFLWRTVIGFDYNITLGESMASGITLIIMGWFLFGYIWALSVKAKGRLELTMAIMGITFALSAINVYALAYYGMKWYSLLGLGGFAEALAPMDYLLRDVGFFSLALFYYTEIIVSKFLDKACADYTVPIKISSAN
jgi:hypothetical protein